MAEVRYAVDPMPSPDQLAFIEASLRNSFRIGSFQAGAGYLRVELIDGESADAVQAMLRRFVFISKNVNKDLVFSGAGRARYGSDPQPELEQRRDVIPIHPGFYSFQGDFLAVMHAINATVLAMANDFGAVEQEHPALWPVRLFKMIDYFHEFPQQVILCAPVKDDFATRSAFSKRYGRDQPFDAIAMDAQMADGTYGLQPAVCDCCYYALEGSREHADTFYTTYNKVFRNERSAIERLDRLTNFSVRDIMFVGSEAFVLEARERLIDRLSELIDALQLQARIETANDPFFANESAMKSVFQNAHKLKYELLAWIPHLERDIAVGSINLHTDFFGKAFDVQQTGGAPVQSGCIGIGMERMAYALFCQHGPHLSEWPEAVRSFLGLAQRRRDQRPAAA